MIVHNDQRSPHPFPQPIQPSSASGDLPPLSLQPHAPASITSFCPVSDLFQFPSVTSLPRLASAAGDALQRDLTAWSRLRPLALVLPTHARELGSPALASIRQSLAATPWLHHVVIGLDAASHDHFLLARSLFNDLPCSVEILWHDNPDAPPLPPEAISLPHGKGRNLWLCTRAALANPNTFAVAAHDADITCASPEFLARLAWPVLHPDAGFAGTKGWYARHAASLHGRLFRLLFQPLRLALAESATQPIPWLDYLGQFRYALSGEWCLRRSALKHIHFGTGWDAEIRMLHAWHSLPDLQICQAELCDAYDHRHHDLAGLGRMASDVAAAIWHAIPSHLQPDPAAILDRFHLTSRKALHQSALVAAANGLQHDPAAEAAAVSAFSAILPHALSPLSSPPALLPPP